LLLAPFSSAALDLFPRRPCGVTPAARLSSLLASSPPKALLFGCRFVQAAIYEGNAVSRQNLFGIRLLGATLLAKLFGATLLCGLAKFGGDRGWINQFLSVNCCCEGEKNQNNSKNQISPPKS